MNDNKFEDLESLPVPSGSLGGGAQASTSTEIPKVSFLSPSSWISFLQAMFDVSTADVLDRLMLAVKPYKLLKDGQQNILLSKPDLYGPFWIATSAIIAMTGAANIERLFVSGYSYTDYSLLLTASWFMYGSLAAVPLVAFLVAWILRRQGETTNVELNYAHLVCMYGYSNLGLIPMSVICVIPVSLLQQLSLALGGANSGVFIVANLWKHMPVSRLRFGVVGAALLCQAITYLAFFYVFLSPT